MRKEAPSPRYHQRSLILSVILHPTYLDLLVGLALELSSLALGLALELGCLSLGRAGNLVGLALGLGRCVGSDLLDLLGDLLCKMLLEGMLIELGETTTYHPSRCP